MFESAKQKIERANYHISDLERQFDAFVTEKPHRFVVNSDPNTGELILRVRFEKPIPGAFALIIGDAVHNMRCGLDHMLWELVGRDGGTQDRHLKFPTGDSRISFEASCQGIKTPSQWVKDAIKATEAFAGGRSAALYELNLFNNADKHTVIKPVLRATSHPPLKIIAPNGSTMHMSVNVIMDGAAEGTNLARIPRGSSVELDDDAKCPPSIFITKVDGRPEPAIGMLKRFSGKLRDAVAAVAARVPNN